MCELTVCACAATHSACAHRSKRAEHCRPAPSQSQTNIHTFHLHTRSNIQRQLCPTQWECLVRIAQNSKSVKNCGLEHAHKCTHAPRSGSRRKRNLQREQKFQSFRFNKLPQFDSCRRAHATRPTPNSPYAHTMMK